MNTDIAVRQHKIILLAVWRIEVYRCREVRLLVVLCVNIIEHVCAHDAQHALAFGSYLVNIHTARFSENVVLVIQRHHRLACVCIDGAVIEFFIIGQSTVVYADILHLHIRIGAVNGDVLRIVLRKVERGVVDVRSRSIAVHVKVHQSIVVLCGYGKRNLYPLVRREVCAELDFTGNLFIVLIGVRNALPCLEARFLRCDKQTFAVVDTLHDIGGTAHNAAYLDGHFDCQSRCLDVGLERLIADNGFCPVGKFQTFARPSVAAPIEAAKLRADIARSPLRRVVLRVASSCRIELGKQSERGFAKVHAAF